MSETTLRCNADGAGEVAWHRIAVPYLMVVEQQLAIYRDDSGQLFTGDLWQKDLVMHLEYLDQLMLASPCYRQRPPRDAKPLPAAGSQLQLIELPPQGSFLQSLRSMPGIVKRLCGAIRRAEIVHSGIVGWPVPMGWVVTPLVLLFRKPLVIIVESAPWRVPEGLAVSWKRRVRAVVQEFLGRWVLRNAALVICTQDEYRRSLLGKRWERGFVIPASWIDERDILDDVEGSGMWDEKLSRSDSGLKVLFVGRLAPEKGVHILLEAIRRLNQESVPMSFGILGEGSLKGECEAAAASLQGSAILEVLGSVPYGEPLFSLIRQYDAVVVPSIGDEQPRIVFDAFSQAIPILASDTPGLRSCVKDGEVGLLAAPNDVSALCDVLRYAANHRAELKKMGLRALNCARKMTHQEMHRQRALLLQALLDGRKQQSSPGVA